MCRFQRLVKSVEVCLLTLYFLQIGHSAEDAERWTVDLCPKDINTIWNKTLFTPAELHSKFCPQLCLDDDQSISSNWTCFSVKCFRCDCTTPRCKVYGTCCPSVAAGPPLGENYHRFRPKELRCEWSPGELFLHVRSCPMSYRDADIQHKCEVNDYYSEYLLETNARVSDDTTGVSYYNKYCAICNNIHMFTPWAISVYCLHFLDLYKATSDHDLLKLSLEEPNCQQRDIPPHMDYWTCQKDWYGPVIDSCNVSGTWVNYDSDIEINCVTSSNDLTRRVSVGISVFKNIFCAICNLRPTAYLDCYSTDSNHEVIPLPPFSLLLKIRNNYLNNGEEVRAFHTCFDELGSSPYCPSVHCSEGKVLYSNTCITALPKIRGLAYCIVGLYEFHNVSYFNESLLSTNILSDIVESLKSWVNNTLGEWTVESNVLVTTAASGAFNKTAPCCLTNGSNNLQLLPPMALFEKLLSELVFFVRIEFIANNFYGRDEVESYFTGVLTRGEIELNVSGVSVLLKYVSDEVTDPMILCKAKGTVCFTSGPAQQPSVRLLNQVWNANDKFIRLNAMSTCPHVIYNHTHFNVRVVDPRTPWKIQISLQLGEITIDFTSHTELIRLSVNGYKTLHICYDLLKNKMADLIRDGKVHKIQFSQYVLTVACLSVSMFCLLCTVCTYLFFSVLRNVAGMHNLFISLSLLLAQASLLLSVHVRLYGAACTAVGIMTHFFWLTTFCWSFFCCFHMYSIFKSTNRTIYASSHIKWLMVKRIILSMLVPLAIVSSVIASDYFSSEGQGLGYGSISCYLNSANLVLISLGAPIACVLALNSFFFISSVYEIYKIRKLQQNTNFKKDERQQMCVYMKLSTLTCMFWGLAILSEALDNDPLRFLSIIINGLQGLFIAMSYMGNRRVLTLYVQWVGRLLTSPAFDDNGTYNFN
ncbi:adhesion G-protein coupled receptor D1 [Biomphalaria pfeifferi]|uniref:Adhesion G-protein coupled receptor D1 n=1 Tax=Biomphalaria pfeifferi TaxID=112525 RepID=A0AAD8BNN1_BIOPF|nr:adhesion G-protein coupled receptor D1 [Biomphalaria pfeifferi]